jgi:hypothetical protein
MDKEIPVDNVAEAFIELLNANGLDYLFLIQGRTPMRSRKQQPNTKPWANVAYPH